MSLSGPQALKALNEALRDIRREESEITKRVSRTSERIGALREAELEQFRLLAELRLTTDIRDELTGRISAAEVRAREILKKHGQDMGVLEKTLDEKEDLLSRLGQERESALNTVSENQKQLEAKAEQVNIALRANSDFSSIFEERARLISMADEAQKKVEQAEGDKQLKGQPYRDDKLFMYLWDRHYGQSAYKANNFIRYLDRKVARLIGYDKVRPNFVMLNEIPERLGEHLQRLNGDVAKADERMAALERDAIDSIGGKSLRIAIETADKRIGAIDAQVLVLEDERETLTTQQKQFTDGSNPKFEEAVNLLTATISATDLTQLYEDARQTSSPEDDIVINRIQDSRKRAQEAQSELEQDRTRLSTLETRRRELEDISFEFKKSRYDDPQSQFGNDKLVGDMLNEFLKGAITASVYWNTWKKSQDFKNSSKSTSRNQNEWPFPGGISGGRGSRGSWTSTVGGPSKSSGGFSRPRSTGKTGGFGGSSGGFKTGGGFKGGSGFKTGGGF